MAIESTQLIQTKASAITVGNAAELVANVITEIAGNDISNTVNNSPVTRDMVRSLVIVRLQRKFQER